MVKKLRKAAGWNLYWVYSDGYEDCFVVARNIRSAIKLEREMNGFEHDEVGAMHVCRIPEFLAKRKLAKYTKDGITWPWYGWDDLLRDLGAEFREVDGREEVMLDYTVYCRGSPPRTIGKRFLKLFRQEDAFNNCGDEDTFSSNQQILFTLLGVCIARCQEIENYIAHSFILATASKDKNKFSTISELTRAWKRRTMGQLIRTIEESYDLDPIFKSSLEQFLKWRNQLAHEITIHPQYDINTVWGQDEMIAFLSFFEILSRAVRKAFRACYLASIDFGNHYLLESPNPKIKFNKKEREEISLFSHFFILKESSHDLKQNAGITPTGS